MLLVCPLLIRFVHLVLVSCEPCCGRGLHAVTIALPQTGAAAKLTGHNSRDASRVRSVRFYWMNRCVVVLPARGVAALPYWWLTVVVTMLIDQARIRTAVAAP